MFETAPFHAALARLSWLAGLAIVAIDAHASSHPPVAYECTLAAGGRVAAGSDLSQSFPLSFKDCERRVPPPARPVARKLFHPEALSAEDRQRLQNGRDARARHAQARSLKSPALPGLALMIDEAARKHQLDPALVAAVVHVESRGQAQARSPKGAIGLMQIIPATGRRYGVADAEDLLQPHINLQAGSRYLSDLLDMFDGRLELALAAYNAGEGAVMRHGWRIPPYAETEAYVEKVLDRYAELAAQPDASE